MVNDIKLGERFEGLAKKRRFAIGRGHGSGLGKTSGAGVKGQKAREGTGGTIRMIGGQQHIIHALPRRGFKGPLYKKDQRIRIVSLTRIGERIQAGSIKEGDVLDVCKLTELNLIDKNYKGKVKIVGDLDLKIKVDFTVNSISKGSKEILEKLGSKITLV